MERWLPVVGYEGLYEVSDQGRVRSVARTVEGRWGSTRRAGAPLALFQDRDGYVRVNLSRDGASRQRGAHQLVLEAFVGPCPQGMECLHGDGTRGNNVLANLAWGTPKANSADRRRHGTGPNGRRNPKAKLCEQQVLRIRGDARAQALIAREYSVDQTTVSDVKRRRTWAEVA
jgi:hypothetical protein